MPEGKARVAVTGAWSDIVMFLMLQEFQCGVIYIDQVYTCIYIVYLRVVAKVSA